MTVQRAELLEMRGDMEGWLYVAHVTRDGSIVDLHGPIERDEWIDENGIIRGIGWADLRHVEPSTLADDCAQLEGMAFNSVDHTEYRNVQS